MTRELVAKSFAGNETVAGEPSFEWVMQYFDGITMQQKLQTVGFFISIYIGEQMRKKCTVFSQKNKDGKLISAALVREYDLEIETHWWNKLRDKILEPLCVMQIASADGFPAPFTDQKLKSTGKTSATVFENMNALWKRAHHKLMPEKHWFFSIVATDPEYQGQGHGSEIMERLTDLADDAKVDCYLECNNEKNKKFYEKFGFVERESGEIENLFDEKGPPNTTYFMVRNHKAA